MTMKNLLLLIALVFLPLVCTAQPPQPSDKEKDVAAAESDGTEAVPPADETEADSSGDSEEERTPLEGDVVIFKKGTELRGVKVVRHSPMFVEIEYIPGEPYLQIPTTQVAEIKYADEKNAEEQTSSEGLALGPDVMPGEEVSPDFHLLLMTVLAEDPISYENEDYLTIILKIAEKLSVKVDVDETLNALMPDERKVSFTLAAGTTFLNFLSKDLAEIAPAVRVILHYDHLALQKRGDIEVSVPTAPVPDVPASAPPGTPPPPAAAMDAPANP